MRRTFSVGDNSYFWLKTAEGAASVYGKPIHQISHDRIDYLNVQIEQYKIKEGLVRKSYIIDRIAELKGLCYVYDCYHATTHKEKQKRDFLFWIIFRFTQIPNSAIAKEFDTKRNTVHKSIGRIEEKVLGDKECFDQLSEMVNFIIKSTDK